MHIVVGPVLTREGGYAFDSWTPEDGLSRGYIYRRIDDAQYARTVEVRSRNKRYAGQTVACSTMDEFVRSTIRSSGSEHRRGVCCVRIAPAVDK
jgi:hypothetical protein